MKERPILFQGAMVRAILDGSKTQTRRVLKPQPPAECGIHYMLGNESWLDEADRAPLRHHWEAWGGPLYENRPAGHLAGSHTVKHPYGAPGDRLWVRETWRGVVPINAPNAPAEYAVARYIPDQEHCRRVEYAATQARDEDPWRPSIHMPRWASRILLEIVSVRVERLNDCSEDDAFDEGIQFLNGRYTFNGGLHESRTAKESFRALWESINGDGSWDINPWLWCISFKRATP